MHGHRITEVSNLFFCKPSMILLSFTFCNFTHCVEIKTKPLDYRSVPITVIETI